MQVVEEKSWAVGLEQHVFEQEFMRRYPHADAIPDANEWPYIEYPKAQGIDFISPDSYEIENPPVKKEPEVVRVFCRGCGRLFDSPKGAKMARAAHEKYCKVFLNTKI